MGLDTLASLFKGGLNSPKSVLANIANTGIIPSRYIVDSIIKPKGVSAIDIAYIKSVTTPSISIDIDSVSRIHRNINSAKKRNLGDLTITFYETKRFDIITAFTEWLNLAFRVDGTYSYESEYKGGILLRSVDDIKELGFTIYPKNIGELVFDDDNDSIMTVTVTFSCEFITGSNLIKR